MLDENKTTLTQMYLGKVGELTLKGGNMHMFEKQLVQNVRHALERVKSHVWLTSGRLYVECSSDSCPAVEYLLDRLPGITGWAKVRVVEKNLESITQAVTSLGREAKEKGAASFKIDARREDKSFPLNSYEICTKAAGGLFDDGTLKVDVHHPDVVINVEVRDRCYVYTTDRKTCRGLPVGVSGKGLLLLSGGIDSPVAGYRMMCRGMQVECAYFHSYPYTSEEAQKKVEALAKILGDFGLSTHLNIIPFTDVQMQIKKKAPAPWLTLMLRLCMMKVANMLSERIGASAIITGESLAQVASQTIENLTVTESFAEKPLLRPLIGMDKEEIIAVSEKIGSYPISILPYEDCCVLFSPKHPVLHATIEEAKEIYDSMEIEDLVREAFEKREIKRFSIQDTIGEKWGLR